MGSRTKYYNEHLTKINKYSMISDTAVLVKNVFIVCVSRVVRVCKSVGASRAVHGAGVRRWAVGCAGAAVGSPCAAVRATSFISP